MNANRDDDRSPTNGLWPRIQASIAHVRERLDRAVRPSSRGDQQLDDETSRRRRGARTNGGRVENGRTAAHILTPEERVVTIVTRNGGGMKQAEIVSALDWSESTVSRKLSELESEATIRRYQIGREKLVYLPGNEPETFGSPFSHFEEDRPVRA